MNLYKNVSNMRIAIRTPFRIVVDPGKTVDIDKFSADMSDVEHFIKRGFLVPANSKVPLKKKETERDNEDNVTKTKSVDGGGVVVTLKEQHEENEKMPDKPHVMRKDGVISVMPPEDEKEEDTTSVKISPELPQNVKDAVKKAEAAIKNKTEKTAKATKKSGKATTQGKARRKTKA